MTQISPNPNPQDNNNHNGSVDQAVSLVDNQSPDPSESETSETPVLSIENQVYPSPEPPREPSPTISPPWHHWPVIQWWQRLTLRSKSILAATVIGVMPVVMVGSLGYKISSDILYRQIEESETAQIEGLSNKVSRFMSDRYIDIQALATVNTFSQAQLRNSLSPQDKQKVLDRYANIYQFYDSIAVFDLKGDVIAQSQGTPLKNHGDRSYFKDVINTKSAVISQPLISTTEGTFNIYFAAPVKDSQTGEIIGVIRSRMPVKNLQKVIKQEGDHASHENKEDIYLVNENQDVFLAPQGVQVTSINSAGQVDENAQQSEQKAVQAPSLFSVYSALANQKQPGAAIDREQFLALAPLPEIDGYGDLGWNGVSALDSAEVFGPQRKLLSAIFLGTLITAGLAGTAAILLSEQIISPLRRVTGAVKKIGEGDLSVEIEASGDDELGVLAENINTMSQRIYSLVEKQTISSQQANLLAEIAGTFISDRQALEQILDHTLEQLRGMLKVDRVVIYQFNFDGNAFISHESVASGYPSAKELEISDRCIPPELMEEYRQGRVVPTDNVHEAGFHPEHHQLMEQLQIQANLVLPIIKQGDVFGLLIAHHCQQPHQWQDQEINFMQRVAEQLNVTIERVTLQQQQRLDARLSQQLRNITVSIATALTTEEIMQVAVKQMRRSLKTDRVIVYTFDEKFLGTIVAEDVADGYTKAINAQILDPCFADKFVDKYLKGRVQATPDIYNAGLTECHLNELEPFQVRANLVVPILRKGKLLGLYIAHQCSGPRNWNPSEISLFSQVGTQIGFALERADLLEEQKKSEEEQRIAKEKLQRRALELLMEVDPVSQGDLTIRAKVTEDEIGTIADSYNATIENLRKIVNQVQNATGQLSETTEQNDSAIRSLSQEAFEQAQDVSAALDKLQVMNTSISAVAANAELAEATVQQAAETVEQGEEAMNRTVDGIMAIRQTVAETAKKVKRLGESSQKISKVVNLISSFADQTNLLALNASIEAAHAGEEGRGFAVVADEVRSLARQSAEATAEIETLVADIQAETNEVVAAMEAGTEQVVTGTKLVDETRKSLNQITVASIQISELVEAITRSAIEQSQTSQTVTQTMSQVAAISDKTSSEAAQVSDSFRELLAVAQSLQESVRQFKVK
ncbi:MAG: methyl-accepting chemotaxis protein [Crocosphaera sp.]|uniref:Tsr or CheD n=3 Tax=Crocosphaera watsonii TaxID=263511 RepID=T2JHX8_CROWT|nr:MULTISPECIES: methyl-accepting chemotaxis protein [Crocosphaera]EHJ13224.1 methyl-accepting chemotaxis sensory transducer with GAF sensor [Crocosphaera watsonii WH 0003]MCH2247625.1 methyl-accepting chemotaxis protein [Crocosphaera sp.]CCQ57189.1 tsr or; CheD [Crocosphaera watsonii WH 0005]CCQ64731.1 tsr or; CheD [Crocosphaera watsonii WH 0402]